MKPAFPQGCPGRPVRALMLTPDEGHLDRRIAQEAGSLAAGRGWEVDIFPVADPGLRFEDRMPDRVRLLSSPRPARSVGRRRIALRRARREIERRAPAVARLVEAARYRRWDIAGALAAANAGHLLTLAPYEVVFAHDVPVFPLAARLKAAWSCLLVCDLHEVFPEQDSYFTTDTARDYWRSVESAGLRVADGIIVVNDAVGDYVRSRYGPSAPIVTILNSVPFIDRAVLDGPTLRAHYPIPEQARIMLFAGSLRPHKNLEILIEGFVRAELDGWVLAVLGEGPLRGELEATVRRMGADGRVYLGERAGQQTLIQVASSADVGLMPYQGLDFNHLIATPNKLFEYIQARLPIATSRLPMIEGIVGVHGNGAFVDYTAPKATAAGLRTFVEEVLPSITVDRTEAAARTFSWENEEMRLFELVDAVTRPRSGC